MKIKHIFEAQSSWEKITKDPRASKLISIAYKQDHTIPYNIRAKLGPTPNDEEIVKAVGHLIDLALSNTRYGNISDGKFDDWIMRQYMNGSLEYEDISGEAGDALGAWKALSKRGMLDELHQDFNKFKDLSTIQKILRLEKYSNSLRKIQDQEALEQAKRDQKYITLIDDDRFYVAIPMNYGACYFFNNAEGVQASFCTGGSSGRDWFRRYADEGPIITVMDKTNINDIKGKWQLHAPTTQIVDASQRNRYGGQREFGELFPGLMFKIVDAMKQKEKDIHELSKIVPNNLRGYDVQAQIKKLRDIFPQAFTSEPTEPESLNQNISSAQA